MHDTRTYTIPELTALLTTLEDACFQPESKAEAYDWIEEQLFKYRYDRLSKSAKGVIRAYLGKFTGYRPSQLTNLIAQWRTTHHVKLASYERHQFATRYTRDDVVLLAQTDTVHHRLSGPATKHLFQRAYAVFGQPEFVRLKDISVAHIYNLRTTFTYRQHAQVYTHTHGPKNTLGERRRPEPNGRPGCIRVDTVHQGDAPDGKKGMYHINFVDEVTQWELVAAVETISDRHMLSILEVILEQFPFVVYEFHSDNGSEFINKKVLDMLRRLHAKLTKSRPRRHNDNALVESKNGSVIRKAWGYDHIPARDAPVLNQWYEDWFNTYLNFHRPCGFATVKRDKKGKERRVYRAEDYQTPYEKFRGLPDAPQYLKPGVTFDQLDFIAYALPDTEFAELMEQAKDRLPIWEQQLSIVS
ncbi:MAG TPA: DDE-type integrase/transposase/recombinase [Candidatus Saccharimonadia bacterium]